MAEAGNIDSLLYAVDEPLKLGNLPDVGEAGIAVKACAFLASAETWVTRQTGIQNGRAA
jgi:hypothetical protein